MPFTHAPLWHGKQDAGTVIWQFKLILLLPSCLIFLNYENKIKLTFCVTFGSHIATEALAHASITGAIQTISWTCC